MWLKKKNQKTLWLDYPAAEVIWTEMDKLISHKIKKQPQELKFPFFLSLNEEEQLNLLLSIIKNAGKNPEWSIPQWDKLK